MLFKERNGKADYDRDAERYGMLKKYGKRKCVKASLVMLVTLIIMGALYSEEFSVSAANEEMLEAAIGEYHFAEVMEVDLLTTTREGKYLFVLYAQEGQKYHCGVAVLERGIFGRYRILQCSNARDSLYHMRTVVLGGQYYAILYGRHSLPGVVLFEVYEPDSSRLLYSGGYDPAPFLEVIRTEKEWSDFSDIRYYNAQGEELSQEELHELYESSAGASVSSVSSAETELVYVWSGLVLGIGVLFGLCILKEKE